MARLWGYVALAGALLMAAGAEAEMMHIEASRDVTLIEDPDGALANGAGPAFFVGRTNQQVNGIRRALVHFDVAAVLPAKAQIERVFFSLHLTSGNASLRRVGLHRVQDAWTEGASFSAGGSGAPAGSGDATWHHSDYPLRYWVRPGAQFIGRASATELVGGNGFYTWQSSPHLVEDVRLWLQAPHRNFGWALLGDEDTPQSVKRFDSRESSTVEYRPVLSVEYRLP